VGRPAPGAGVTISDKQDAEFQCKFCDQKKFKSSATFMNHLSTSHVSVEGGSYICRYGENNICSACPGVGVSQVDYNSHVTRHHIHRDKVVFNPNNDFWNVLSSSVNLPAVLNNPAKGKQKDFFTRSWGADFVDSAILPPSPNVCEIPPNTFDRYLKKVRKNYVRHKVNSGVSLPPSGGSSRETTPSPGSSKSSTSSLIKRSPVPTPPPKLNIPSVFLDQDFDLSNPTTFNAVFPFLTESLSQTNRSNPFQIESKDAKHVESGGRLVQEKLQHYIDQVEVNIASQVCTKSHHFFQVMTYHDALMSQLISLISVVRTVRKRLAHVQDGVLAAIRVPQLAVRASNLESLLGVLSTIDTLHKTQPTIQLQLTRQEFAAALELISTSKDILNNETVNIECLKHLPSQLDELVSVIEKMLLADFESIIAAEFERDMDLIKLSELGETIERDTKYDECMLSAIVSGMVRQQNFKFLEFFEHQSISCLKNVIKEVVLSVLDVTEETTLTNLVAEFAGKASSQDWAGLIDLLCGSCLALVAARVQPIQHLICSTQELSESHNASVNTPIINICDQLHERLGKLVSLRSRPAGLVLVTPQELVDLGNVIQSLITRTQDLCGTSRVSASLSLSHTTLTVVFVQQMGDQVRGDLVSSMEVEKWKRGSVSPNVVRDFHSCIRNNFDLSNATGDAEINEIVTTSGEKYAFVNSVMKLLTSISDYCKLADQIAQASTEIGQKTSELLKLFNSRTCQLVLGAGAVSVAGLKTITIRNLAVTRASLSLSSLIINCVKNHLMELSGNLTEKQSTTLARNFDNASKDYQEHLAELDKKIIQVVDAALNQQLANWERKPPVPSESFKSIGKQLTKFHEAVHDILSPEKVTNLFLTIHNQFLLRVKSKLAEVGMRPDNSPTHGLVMSELIFYRENLKYINVLPEETLKDAALSVIWG